MKDLIFKLTLIFLLPALIPTADLLLAWSRWRDFTHCPAGTTPSALTFGYSDLRPGSAPSCLSSGWYPGLDSAKLEPDTGNTPAMLLYWNGIAEKEGPFRGKRVLVGQAYPAAVYAFDLDEKKILWRHDFFPAEKANRNTMPINSSAPVIDRKSLRIYGSFIEERFGGRKATDSRLTQHYYSIGLDGSGAEHRVVDLAKILLEKGTKATPDEISKYIRCRTALGINRQASPPYVYSGCSVARAFSYQGAQFVHQESKQETKGIRGVLLAMPLDPASGRFAPVDPAYFIPSKLGPEPEAGVDGGIWHSGGAPTVLPGNKLLLATGNGLFKPEEEVYGCSVVRLDGATLRPDGPSSHYFSAKGQNPLGAGRSCHAGNLDPSSSSAATLERNGRFYSVIGGKDGWLKAFDPLQLPGTEADPNSEAKIVDGFLFGQPVIFPGLRNAGIVSIGGNGSNGLQWVGYKLTEGYELRKRWENTSPHPRAFNSSAAGTYTDDGDSPLLMIPLIAGGPERPLHSSLQLVDAENGHILDELYYEGNSHFSMPTVVDDRIFVATTENGIREFRAKRTFRDFLHHHAWVGRFVRHLIWF
jgi:hypothetical protein